MTKLSESIWVDQYESNLTIGEASYFEYDKDTVISLSNAETEKLFAFICANKSDWLAEYRKKVLLEVAEQFETHNDGAPLVTGKQIGRMLRGIANKGDKT